VEVPLGIPSVVYTAKEHPTRAAAAAAVATVGRGDIESADNNGRVPQCVPAVRGFLVVTPRRISLSWLLLARRRLDVTRLRVTVSKVHVDSFHVNNVKMSQRESLRCGKIRADNGPVYLQRA